MRLKMACQMLADDFLIKNNNQSSIWEVRIFYLGISVGPHRIHNEKQKEESWTPALPSPPPNSRKFLIFILFLKTCTNTNLKVINQAQPVPWRDYSINCCKNITIPGLMFIDRTQLLFSCPASAVCKLSGSPPLTAINLVLLKGKSS